ncbi:OmpA family protein [Holophaga foetida]|uniref:OmpA family protein n=1 Tax=Holophaga foetida TaxID=35839 RepID=UPI0002471CD5|nr:OmpA family protein [Holophaga foetida]
MRFAQIVIPVAVLLTMGAGMACKKPAPVPEQPKVDDDAATRAAAEEEARRRAAAEAEARRLAESDAAKAKAAAEAEAARRAEAEKAASFQRAAEAALKDVNFDFDHSGIREADKAKLQAIADFMKAYAQAKVQVEGHCDERGTVEYNLALGDRRAHSAYAYLTGLGVAEDRLSTISYGKEKPKVQGKDEETWLINRRCEFKLK